MAMTERLNQNVADVAGLQKDGRRQADHRDEDEQNQEGTDAEEPQADRHGAAGFARLFHFDGAGSDFRLLPHHFRHDGDPSQGMFHYIEKPTYRRLVNLFFMD